MNISEATPKNSYERSLQVTIGADDEYSYYQISFNNGSDQSNNVETMFASTNQLECNVNMEAIKVDGQSGGQFAVKCIKPLKPKHAKDGRISGLTLEISSSEPGKLQRSTGKEIVINNPTQETHTVLFKDSAGLQLKYVTGRISAKTD